MNFPEANEAYPFDGSDTRFLDGLEKLRGIQDQKLRELVWEAYEERDRRSRGQAWASKKPDPRLTPASREFVDRKRRASGDEDFTDPTTGRETE